MQRKNYWADWQTALKTLQPQELLALLAAAEKNPARQPRENLQLNILSRLAEVDPASGMDYAAQMDRKRLRQQALSAVFNSWCSVNPRDAVAWAKQLPPGREREEYLRNSLYQLAQADPELAFGVYGDIKLTGSPLQAHLFVPYFLSMG